MPDAVSVFLACEMPPTVAEWSDMVPPDDTTISVVASVPEELRQLPEEYTYPAET